MGGLGMCPEDALGAIRRELASGLWYLATVYTKHPDGLDKAYRDANETAARVISIYGARVFCPIAHSHSLCDVYGTRNGLAGETDAEFWKWYDRPFLERAAGLLVTMMPGWKDSEGIAHEIEVMRIMKRPILYLSWPDLHPVRLERAGSYCDPAQLTAQVGSASSSQSSSDSA